MSILSKDTDSEVSKYFGIDPLEEVIDVRSDKFLKRYCATDYYLCRLIKRSKRSKVKEIIVLIKARSFLDELNLEHLTS